MFIIILNEKEEKAKKKKKTIDEKQRLDFPGTKGSTPRF